MAATNTEKPASKAEKKRNAPAVKEKKPVVNVVPVKKEIKETVPSSESKIKAPVKEEAPKGVSPKSDDGSKKKIEVKKIKKNIASVDVSGVHASTKVSGVPVPVKGVALVTCWVQVLNTWFIIPDIPTMANNGLGGVIILNLQYPL